MEQISKEIGTQAAPGSETKRRRTADYVYQVATVAAALLLLLTATV